jgi:hypothetical protein
VRLALIAAGIVGVAAITYVVWLDGAGYCFPERRFLSDAEKIEAAANYAARRGFHVRFRVDWRDGRSAEVAVPTPTYPSAAEFMAANPGCCRMMDPGSTEGLRHPEWASEPRHRRPERSVVVVDMAVPFTNPDGGRRTATIRTNLGVRPCGYVEPRHLLKRVAQFTRKAALG